MKQCKKHIYEVGEKGLVRYKTRKNNRLPNKAWALLGTVIKADKRNHKYQVSFVPPYSKVNQKQWFYVSDITGPSLSGHDKQSFNATQRQKKHLNHKSPYYMILTAKDKTCNLMSDFRSTVAFNPIGDGNCQFAAISHQLQSIGIYRSAETLRREVITYIGQTSRLGSADNRVLWSNLLIESRSNCLRRMARTTEFGDQITLQAISDMFNVQIVSTLNHGTTLVRPDGKNTITRHLLIITIGHYPEGQGEHYLSLTYNHNALRRITEDSSQIHWGYDDTDDKHDDTYDEHDDTEDKHDDTDDEHDDTDDKQVDTDDEHDDTDDKHIDTDDEHHNAGDEHHDTDDEHHDTGDEHHDINDEQHDTDDEHHDTGDKQHDTDDEHHDTGDKQHDTDDEHHDTGDEHQ
ncbi:unnamed protein product [Mytilus coruscus]|uniref:OTU domain-containing protein n=1 Tax=Mytilus coruscus TaxID=42192 RepID=A0A6J8A210_MYTCO|nr:unnamed protein product [Mytilus coruscus]